MARGCSLSFEQRWGEGTRVSWALGGQARLTPGLEDVELGYSASMGGCLKTKFLVSGSWICTFIIKWKGRGQALHLDESSFYIQTYLLNRLHRCDVELPVNGERDRTVQESEDEHSAWTRITRPILWGTDPLSLGLHLKISGKQQSTGRVRMLLSNLELAVVPSHSFGSVFVFRSWTRCG